MGYKNIYNGLTSEEKEKMLQADVPQFVTVKKEEVSEEKRIHARKILDFLIEQSQTAEAEKRDFDLSKLPSTEDILKE